MMNEDDFTLDKNLDILLKRGGWRIRKSLLYKEHALEKLITDNYSNWTKSTKVELIKLGYGLDILIYDPSFDVRVEVAKCGYRLDKLINDESYEVKSVLLEQLYGIEILINDKSPNIKAVIANAGYGRDILIYEPSWEVKFWGSTAWEDTIV